MLSSPSAQHPNRAAATVKPTASHIAYVGQRIFEAQVNEGSIQIIEPATTHRFQWSVAETATTLTLTLLNSHSTNADDEAFIAAIDTAFVLHPGLSHLSVQAPIPKSSSLVHFGALRPTKDGAMQADRAAMWQHAALCQATLPSHYALRHTTTNGRRHPLRPLNNVGTVYRRYIPWLQRSLNFRTVDALGDVACFHRWMNDPVVDEFWGERGSLDHHREYLERIATDPHALPLFVCFDDEPVGYIEAYWAREDRIGAHYDAADFDRGWHVFIGESAYRGRPFVSAWMPSISHYLFLADCRTQRIVIEPRIDNMKMIRSLARSGYTLVKEISFPHKRAMLGMLLRNKFFDESLLWPRDQATPCYDRG